jgi:hypothetical protein
MKMKVDSGSHQAVLPDLCSSHLFYHPQYESYHRYSPSPVSVGSILEFHGKLSFWKSLSLIYVWLRNCLKIEVRSFGLLSSTKQATINNLDSTEHLFEMPVHSWWKHGSSGDSCKSHSDRSCSGQVRSFWKYIYLLFVATYFKSLPMLWNVYWFTAGFSACSAFMWRSEFPFLRKSFSVLF